MVGLSQGIRVECLSRAACVDLSGVVCSVGSDTRRFAQDWLSGKRCRRRAQAFSVCCTPLGKQ